MALSDKPHQGQSAMQAQMSEYRNVSTDQDIPMKIIFALGAPGVGKGTICKKHPGEYGYKHISVGDYMRELCVKDQDLPASRRAGLSPEEIEATMKQARLLPAEPMVEILRVKLQQEHEAGNNHFVIDGFPRTKESAMLFDEKIVKPSMVWLFRCPKDTAKSRFLARAREAADSEKKFEARYAQFLEENAAVLEWYEPLVHEIDTNCAEEQSHEIVLGLLKQNESEHMAALMV